MKKSLSLAALFLTLSIALFSFTNSGKTSFLLAASAGNAFKKNADSASVNDSSSIAVSADQALYNRLHLQDAGLSMQALSLAMKGYEKLLEEGNVQNQKYLTIVDLSQSSRKKRFYLLDMENQKLIVNTFVAHGRNSGIDDAEQFSNDPNSNESSLGFYLTKNTYMGKHGLSLKLSGQEAGFNDNAEARGIVVHGAPYVNEGRVASDYMGRSQGCPALPENEYAHIISLIKDGSVLFIYHPDNQYITGSSLLNS